MTPILNAIRDASFTPRELKERRDLASCFMLVKTALRIEAIALAAIGFATQSLTPLFLGYLALECSHLAQNSLEVLEDYSIEIYTQLSKTARSQQFFRNTPLLQLALEPSFQKIFEKAPTVHY